jgi:hypothetical protein
VAISASDETVLPGTTDSAVIECIASRAQRNLDITVSTRTPSKTAISA